MKLSELIKLPEGRCLEFKRELPTHADLCKTVVAFANDAGGEILIGIQDNPREIVGVSEENLLKIEEQISQIISNGCNPLIRPEIIFFQENGRHLIRIWVCQGYNPPYYLKPEGEEKGTYIRVGSTNHLASNEMIQELKRKALDVSIDSEVLIRYDDIKLEDFSIFSKSLKDILHEDLDVNVLKKLKLVKPYNNSLRPTGAYFLFADEEIKSQLFPYAKIECARFKGTKVGEMLDKKSFQGSIVQQAELAYDFVLRHINQGSTIEGVYTKSRWEYPVFAIREVIRNAVVHRDYSLSGMDIKIAIFDDMIEITSPGKLMPSIDFDDLDSGQSDVRNKVIAPIFKQLGIIDQWGNGLRIINKELKDYPDIEFRWSERGMLFQIQFVKKQMQSKIREKEEIPITEITSLDEVVQSLGTKLALSWHQVGTKLAPSWKIVCLILESCLNPVSIQIIMENTEWKDRTKFRKKYVKPLLELDLLEMTNPQKPTSSNQQYFLTEKGKKILKKLMELI